MNSLWLRAARKKLLYREYRFFTSVGKISSKAKAPMIFPIYHLSCTEWPFLIFPGIRKGSKVSLDIARGIDAALNGRARPGAGIREFMPKAVVVAPDACFLGSAFLYCQPNHQRQVDSYIVSVWQKHPVQCASLIDPLQKPLHLTR
jgi:hypothetical protein